jgi:fumarylacetoacetate (FAA) hydrolase
VAQAPSIGHGGARRALPRAWQWLDSSLQHGALMAKAFGRPPISNSLMYRGCHTVSWDPRCSVFPREEDGIDFEGEFAVITSAVPMAVDRRGLLRRYAW